jgi:hypothetical protein
MENTMRTYMETINTIRAAMDLLEPELAPYEGEGHSTFAARLDAVAEWLRWVAQPLPPFNPTPDNDVLEQYRKRGKGLDAAEEKILEWFPVPGDPRVEYIENAKIIFDTEDAKLIHSDADLWGLK